MKIIINLSGEIMDADSSILSNITKINKIGDTYFGSIKGVHFSVHENYYLLAIRENKLNEILK